MLDEMTLSFSKMEVKCYHAFPVGVLQPGIYISLFSPPHTKEVLKASLNRFLEYRCGYVHGFRHAGESIYHLQMVVFFLVGVIYCCMSPLDRK